MHTPDSSRISPSTTTTEEAGNVASSVSADTAEHRPLATTELVRAVHQAVEDTARRCVELLKGDLKDLAIDREVVETLHNQNRFLIERQFEREVLRPLSLSLIGIIDRCTTEIERLRAQQRCTPDTEVHLALCELIESRSADQIELEDALARLGIESFQDPSSHFSPSTQKPVELKRTEDHKLLQRVARRIAPGYRRGDDIVRPEYVAVFVQAVSA